MTCRLSKITPSAVGRSPASAERRPAEPRTSAGLRRLWSLSPFDRAVALIALGLAAAMGAIGMAIVDRDAGKRAEQPVLLDLRGGTR